ncbi:MAG TPA: aminotransferase class IV [Geminicoccaceae bacterium]|nr:aminotransferase class IV [Geminicoccaceae bacterium]
MSERANERVAWFNGSFMPESRVQVPFRDRSFIYGDGAFDMTRTFARRIFKLDEHLTRFYRSLKYLRIDPGIGPKELAEVTMEVLERNLHLLGPDEDYWVAQRVSRGVKSFEGDGVEHHGPNVIVECSPLPLGERASLYRDGIRVTVPSVRRVPPESLTPRAKTHNYLNLIVGDQEAQARDPGSWAVLLDVNGNLGEGLGSNIFLVQDGELLTPREKLVLAGVSRATVIELAAELGIACHQTDLDLYDAYTADEAFLTSTSLCICPIASVNGQRIGAGRPFGPVTRRLTDAYIRLVDCDFVEQYLQRLS